MSKKDKSKKITFKSILRFIIFLILVWLLISFFNQKNLEKEPVNDPTISLDEFNQSLSGDVLGEMYQKLPQDTRNQFEDFWNNSSGFIQQKLNGFPQNQIKEIKKAVIKNISDEMIKNIDEN